MTMMQEKKKDVQLQAMWFAAGTAAAMACLQRAVLMSFMEQWRMLVFLALNLLLLAILFTSTHNNTICSISSTDRGGSSSSSSSSTSVEVEVEVDDKKNWKKQTGLSSVSSDPPAADEHKEDGRTDHKSNSELLKFKRSKTDSELLKFKRSKTDSELLKCKSSKTDSELLKCKSSKTENVPHIINETEDHDDDVKNEEGEGRDQELSMEELNRRAEAFIAMFRQHLLSDAKVGNRCRLHPHSPHSRGGEIFMPKSRAYRTV